MTGSRRRRCRGEGGLVATVIILPVVVLAVWISLQAALVMHARNVARAAAEDAVVAAATGSGNPSTVAQGLTRSSAGSITSNVAVTPNVGPQTVTVTVSADVVSVLPFGSYRVSESASASIEVFIPESQRP